LLLVPDHDGVAHGLRVARNGGVLEKPADLLVHVADDEEWHEVLEAHERVVVQPPGGGRHDHIVAEGPRPLASRGVLHQGDAEGERVRHRSQHGHGPDDADEGAGREARVEPRLERDGDGAVAVHRDRRQREDGHVHGHHLHERAEGAHEARQEPALQQGRLEVERDREEPDDDVADGQVGDQVVRLGAHPPRRGHDPEHERVAHHGHQGDGAVAEGQQRDHLQGHLVQPTRGRRGSGPAAVGLVRFVAGHQLHDGHLH
ncbi:unnamed protein product, partial [Ixodes pacificus]